MSKLSFSTIIYKALPWWKRLFLSQSRLATQIELALRDHNYRILPYDRFAVIYDTVSDPMFDSEEQYYEQFENPSEAKRMYRGAFGDTKHNPRLVLILGPIGDF